MFMSQGEEYVIIKATISSSLKLQFKLLCIERALNMREVVNILISEWVISDGLMLNLDFHECNESNGIIKATIPRELKIEFKSLCARRNLTLRFVLCSLIHHYVKEHEQSYRLHPENQV
ncbi:MAG: hypothetical protein QNJ63_17680 [Calothrix sp. MO_192.B10]|nr:hypothetical protein [Calothrix sp. MO_192.B10]